MDCTIIKFTDDTKVCVCVYEGEGDLLIFAKSVPPSRRT